MNEERFLSVEKDVEIIKATQGPLLDKIEKNTEANIRSEKAIVGLTYSIDSLVNIQTEMSQKYEEMNDRVQTLETNYAVNQSGRDLIKLVIYLFVGTTLAGAGGVVFFILKMYFTATGK